MRYIKQIDALRCFAVVSVVLSHWIPKANKIVKFGGVGVNMFFVISGFLITGILISEREKAKREGISGGVLLKNFLVRRTLRIFPIYYVSLLCFYLVERFSGVDFFHHDGTINYFLTYTSNFYFYFRDGFDGYISHYWSLAVEEQFYLVWPFLMLFLNRKHSYYVIIASIIIGFISPFVIPGVHADVLTPSCMISLGLGGLLSHFIEYRKDELIKYRMQIFYVGMVSLVLFAFSNIIRKHFPQYPDRLLFSIFSAVAIMYCLGIYKRVKLLDKILDNSILISLGKISYGLYLFHNLMPVFWRTWLDKPFLSLFHSMGFSAGSAITIVCGLVARFLLVVLFCSISFRFFEKPIQTLKKYFTTKSPRTDLENIANNTAAPVEGR